MNSTTTPKKIQAPRQHVPTSQVVSKMLDSIGLQKEHQSQGNELLHLKTQIVRQEKPEAYMHD